MQINKLVQIPFTYHSVLKDEFKKGNLPTVKVDPMGDKLTDKNATLDHFIPRSNKGRGGLTNYLLMTSENNQLKANKAPSEVIKPKGLITYLTQFFGVKAGRFDGNKYVKGIVKTAEKAGIIFENEFKETVKNLDIRG